jgi:MFS family permease
MENSVNKITVLSSFGMLLDGYQLTVIAFAVILIQNYIPLSSLEYGLIIASVIIGAIIGTIMVGYLSDIFGRRRIYLSTLVFFIIFDLISVFSVNFIMLFISRVLLGIVLGAEYPVANSYIAEVTPDEKRGFYLAMATVFFSIGSISSAIVAIFMFPFGNIGWRLMLGVAIIPAIIVEFMRFSLPESKMWEQKKEKTKFFEMFSKKYYKNIVIAALIWFLYDIVAYGLSLTLPTILKLGHFVTNVDNAIVTTFFLVIGIISGIFVMMKVDKYGRKGIQITGFLFMAALFLILPHFYYLAGIITIVSFLELFNSFDGATVGIIPAEVTVTEFRGTSYGFSSMMGKIGAVIGVIAMSLLIHGKNYFDAYYFLAAIMVVAILLTLLLPETKKMVLK